MNPPHTTRAFTLIELVVVIGITVAMMVALANLYVDFDGIYGIQQFESDTSSSAGAVVNETENIALPADAVLASHVFSSGTYSSGPSTLVVEIPSIDSSGTVISNTYDYAVIYVNGTTAYRILEANSASSRISGTKILSTTINALTFTYDNAVYTEVKEVDVNVTTQTTLKGAPVQAQLDSHFYLRNHL